MSRRAFPLLLPGLVLLVTHCGRGDGSEPPYTPEHLRGQQFAAL